MPKSKRTLKTVFKIHSAQAVLHHATDKTAKLSNLFVQQRGKGHGSALLAEITRYADERGLTLWLEVQRYGAPRDGLDNSQLVRLYEKHGFNIIDDGSKPIMMGRKPLLKGGNDDD